MIAVGAHRPADLRLLGAGDHADRVGPAGQRELRRVTAQAAAGAPDQHVVALLHAGAVTGDQLPVGGGVDQAGGRRLLPAEVARLGHQLVGLDQGDLGEAAEVGLEPPDALLRVEHRVVVAVGRLQLHRQAVRDDLVAGVPGVDPGTGAQHDARQVGADDVVRQVVALGQRRELPVPLQEGEGGDGLEDRGPHRVVVDGTGHDGDQGLARSQFRHRHVVEVERLARVLLPAGEPGEHLRVLLAHRDGTVGLGQGQSREVGGGGVRCEDRVKDLVHLGASGEALWRTLEGTLGSRGVPSVRREVLPCRWHGWNERAVARIACDAGVRTLWGQTAYEETLYAARPDCPQRMARSARRKVTACQWSSPQVGVGPDLSRRPGSQMSLSAFSTARSTCAGEAPVRATAT